MEVYLLSVHRIQGMSQELPSYEDLYPDGGSKYQYDDTSGSKIDIK